MNKIPSLPCNYGQPDIGQLLRFETVAPGGVGLGGKEYYSMIN
jgi:hypothetical protein